MFSFASGKDNWIFLSFPFEKEVFDIIFFLERPTLASYWIVINLTLIDFNIYLNKQKKYVKNSVDLMAVQALVHHHKIKIVTLFSIKIP